MTATNKTQEGTVLKEPDVKLAPDAADKMSDLLLDPTFIIPTDSQASDDMTNEEKLNMLNGMKELMAEVFTPEDYSKIVGYFKKKTGKRGVLMEVWEYVSSKLSASGE